jgi:peptidoglycan hydrolase CwlO-like protein
MSVNTSSIFYTLGSKVKTELDKKLNLTGGTLTGALTLSGAPTADLHAATKAYVDSVASSGSSTQSELDATQTGAGLGTDGAYSANGSANYISAASSLKDADNKLDAQIKTNADNISSNTTDITELNSELDSAEADIATLQSNVSSNDSDIATLQSNVSSNDSDIATLQSNVSSNDSDIATLQSNVSSNDSDIATLQSNVSSNDTDIAALQTQAGSLATDGNSASFSGNISAANATFSGNLTVNGTTTTIDTTNIDVADSLMNLSKGASDGANASNDGGFIVERGSSENNVAFIWDEGSDKFTCLSTSATAAATDVSSTDSTASLAVLDADLYQNGTSVGSVADFESALTGGSSGSGA